MTKNVALALMLCAGLGAGAQEAPTKFKTEYTKLSIGASTVQFRDFATSPLVYSGPAMYGDFGSYTERGTTITEYGSHVLFGSAFDPYFSAASTITAINVYYGKLFRVAPDFKYGALHVGGLLEGTGTIRVNGSLMNNALGTELAPALYASGKFTRDISRRRARIWKPIKFIPALTLRERERTLSFRTNVGLLNGGYRNGYAYSGQTALLNSFELFEDYVYDATAGARFSGELALTNYLPNGNRVEYSYYFQQFALNGFDRFEWMQQGLKATIYFQTKQKAL